MGDLPYGYLRPALRQDVEMNDGRMHLMILILMLRPEMGILPRAQDAPPLLLLAARELVLPSRDIHHNLIWLKDLVKQNVIQW